MQALQELGEIQSAKAQSNHFFQVYSYLHLSLSKNPEQYEMFEAFREKELKMERLLLKRYQDDDQLFSVWKDNFPSFATEEEYQAYFGYDTENPNQEQIQRRKKFEDIQQKTASQIFKK